MDLLEKIPVVCQNEQYVSAMQGTGIWELKEHIGKLAPTDEMKLQIVGDLITPSDFVVLVVPIDKLRQKVA